MLCASGNSFLNPPDCIFFQPCQANATHQEWHRHEKYPDLFALVYLSYFAIGLCGAENVSKKSRFCSFPYTFETRISCIPIPTISGDCALLPRSSTHPPASPIQASAWLCLMKGKRSSLWTCIWTIVAILLRLCNSSLPSLMLLHVWNYLHGMFVPNCGRMNNFQSYLCNFTQFS